MKVGKDQNIIQSNIWIPSTKLIAKSSTKEKQSIPFLIAPTDWKSFIIKIILQHYLRVTIKVAYIFFYWLHQILTKLYSITLSPFHTCWKWDSSCLIFQAHATREQLSWDAKLGSLHKVHTFALCFLGPLNLFTTRLLLIQEQFPILSNILPLRLFYFYLTPLFSEYRSISLFMCDIQNSTLLEQSYQESRTKTPFSFTIIVSTEIEYTLWFLLMGGILVVLLFCQ